jgi:hypothetical protein
MRLTELDAANNADWLFLATLCFLMMTGPLLLVFAFLWQPGDNFLIPIVILFALFASSVHVLRPTLNNRVIAKTSWDCWGVEPIISEEEWPEPEDETNRPFV